MAAKATPRKVAAKEVVDGPDVESGLKPFTWKPKSGADPIVLPSAAAAIPKNRQLKFFYEMHKRSNDFVAQVTYALSAAGASSLAQDQVFDLDDGEIMDLVNAWTEALTGAPLGES